MAKIRSSSILHHHEHLASVTESWSFERSETSLSQYVMLNGLQHMLILGHVVRARHQLAKLMYTGALLDWYYQKKHDDYSPVLRLWRVLGLNFAENAYLDQLQSLQVTVTEHFRVLRQVVEFIRDAFGTTLAVEVANVSKEKHQQAFADGFDLAESYRQLALALKANKQTSESVPWMREALGMQRAVLTQDDPRLYVSVNSLASILNSVQQFDESIQLYEEAIEHRGRLLGEEHPKTLISVSSYAFLLNKTKQFAKAKPFHERVLKGREKILGLQHPKTLIAMYNYGSCLRPLGFLRQAYQIYQRCFELRKAVLGATHRQTVNAQKQVKQLRTLLAKSKQPLEEEMRVILGLKESDAS